MPEPEPRPAPPPPKPAPAPRAPGLGELFEQSLTAIADPTVFRRAAARPAPSFGAAGGLALAAGAAALAVNVAYALIASPGVLRERSPLILAAFGAAALGLYVSLLLLLAVALYAIAKGFGGRGEFERALQAAAMISVLAPVQMLCNWFPFAWVVPALLAAWVAAGALEGLFETRPGPARAFCALLAAAAIGVQAAGRALADRARDAYAATQAVEAVRDASASNADLARSMSAFAQQAQALNAAAAASAPPPASGLDLLRGPAEGGTAASSEDQSPDAPLPGGTPPDGAAQGALPPGADATMRAMQANSAGMLDALAPMLSMMTASKTLAPQQKADIAELQGLMGELKTQMVSGKRMDKAEFAQKMARYQSLLLKVMSHAAAAQPPAVPNAGTKPPAAAP